MQKISLKFAVAGMVLAREVCRIDSSSSMPVCGKDTELTSALIMRLENMGIKTIYVKGHPIWVAGDHTLEEMLEELDRRFEKVLQDPQMAKIHDIYVAYLKRAMGDDSER